MSKPGIATMPGTRMKPAGCKRGLWCCADRFRMKECMKIMLSSKGFDSSCGGAQSTFCQAAAKRPGVRGHPDSNPGNYLAEVQT